MIVGMAGETTSCSIAVTIIATRSAAVTIPPARDPRPGRWLLVFSVGLPVSVAIRSSRPTPLCAISDVLQGSRAFYPPRQPRHGQEAFRIASPAILQAVSATPANPTETPSSSSASRSQTGWVNAPLQATSQASSRDPGPALQIGP